MSMIETYRDILSEKSDRSRINVSAWIVVAALSVVIVLLA
jgi:hypothetical protein